LQLAFYHLTRSTAEQALPRLLGRTLDSGERALVLCADTRRAQAIDEALWQAPEPAWLPHGTARMGHAAHQPVWIEPAADFTASGGPAPNGARYLFLLDGVEPPPRSEAFERMFDLFDGGDAAAVAAARVRWNGARQVGLRPTYWQQTERGWQKAG